MNSEKISSEKRSSEKMSNEKMSSKVKSSEIISSEMKCNNMISNEITNSNGATSEGKISENETEVFKIRDVKGDGNCLFRCFSRYLYGMEERHKEIRFKIVRYVARDWKYFGDKSHRKNSKEYVNEMGKDRTFGTDLEIEIFSKLLGSEIVTSREQDGRRKWVVCSRLTFLYV